MGEARAAVTALLPGGRLRTEGFHLSGSQKPHKALQPLGRFHASASLEVPADVKGALYILSCFLVLFLWQDVFPFLSPERHALDFASSNSVKSGALY